MRSFSISCSHVSVGRVSACYPFRKQREQERLEKLSANIDVRLDLINFTDTNIVNY